MKRIMLSFAAVALMLVATETASAQTIVVGGGYYPSSGVIYSSYPAPVYYSQPIYYAAPRVYSYPAYGYGGYGGYGYGGYGYGPSIAYSTRVGNSGRLTVGYGPGGGWGGYGWGGRRWR